VASGIAANDDAVHFAATLEKYLSVCCRADTG